MIKNRSEECPLAVRFSQIKAKLNSMLPRSINRKLKCMQLPIRGNLNTYAQQHIVALGQ